MRVQVKQLACIVELRRCTLYSHVIPLMGDSVSLLRDQSTGTTKRLRGVHWVPLSHVVKASRTKVGSTV